VPSSLRPIWGPPAESDRDKLYSEEQVHQALLGYAQREGLSAGDGTLKLDRCAPPFPPGDVCSMDGLPRQIRASSAGNIFHLDTEERIEMWIQSHDAIAYDKPLSSLSKLLDRGLGITCEYCACQAAGGGPV
jgi:hypothetical protein